MKVILYHSLLGDEVFIVSPDNEDSFLKDLLEVENYSREEFAGDYLRIGIDSTIIIDS